MAARTIYSVNERFSLNGSAGATFVQMHNDPEPTQITRIGNDGLPVSVTTQPSDTQSGFTFLANASYIPMAGAMLDAGASQLMSTDSNGDPIITRTVFFNGSIPLSERWRFVAGSSYTEYAADDSLSDSINRYELSGSLSYSLTPNISLVAGYNYAKQNDVSSGLSNQATFDTNDYTVNRAFLGITSGFVGLPM